MAKSIATCTCSTCGAKFEKEVFGHNRAEAESKRTWAEDHYDLCPACYKAKQASDDDRLATEFHLPALTGTERQISYANSLRIQHIRHIPEYFRELRAAYESFSTPEIQAKAKDHYPNEETTPENLAKLFVRDEYWRKADYAALLESDAGKVIDAIRNK